MDRVLISVFVISGLMAGFAGVLTAGGTDAGFPTAGELQVAYRHRRRDHRRRELLRSRGTVINVIVGALIIGVIQNGLNLLNVNVYYQLVATGVIVVIAVELDVLQAQARATLPYTPGQGGMRHGDRAGTAGSGRRTEVPSSR